jgi:hypothetical protein
MEGLTCSRERLKMRERSRPTGHLPKHGRSASRRIYTGPPFMVTRKSAFEVPVAEFAAALLARAVAERKALVVFEGGDLQRENYAHRYLDKQARRVHSERLFSMSVLAAVIVAGLCFMAAGIPGGWELVIGGRQTPSRSAVRCDSCLTYRFNSGGLSGWARL